MNLYVDLFSAAIANVTQQATQCSQFKMLFRLVHLHANQLHNQAHVAQKQNANNEVHRNQEQSNEFIRARSCLQQNPTIPLKTNANVCSDGF